MSNLILFSLLQHFIIICNYFSPYIGWRTHCWCGEIQSHRVQCKTRLTNVASKMSFLCYELLRENCLRELTNTKLDRQTYPHFWVWTGQSDWKTLSKEHTSKSQQVLPSLHKFLHVETSLSKSIQVFTSINKF
jgi:hypothetical protein